MASPPNAVNTWGLSWRDGGTHNNLLNGYRPGWSAVGDIAILNCISIIRGSGVWNDMQAEYEPHDDMPISCDPPFWQGGGGSAKPVRRNFMFGDGHGAYVNRPNRSFTPADSF